VNGACRVCELLGRERRYVDLALARGRSPRWIARRFLNLSKAHFAHHRDTCLQGDPIKVVARSMGFELVEEEAAS